MNISIYIAVSSRVKKFIEMNYGENFPINESTILLGLMNQQSLPEDQKTRRSEIIEIECNQALGALTTMNVLWEFLDRLFYHQFIYFVEVRVLCGHKAFDAIRDFCNYYGITEDEFSQETARRMWQRHLSRKKKQSKELTPMIHESI